MRCCCGWEVERMRIIGTPKEINWLLESLMHGTDCDACPFLEPCDEIRRAEEQAGKQLGEFTPCSEVLRRMIDFSTITNKTE